MTVAADVGRILRARRERAGLSQAQLAALTGMRASEISRYERGGREPRLSALVRLARALELTPAELVDRLDQPESR